MPIGDPVPFREAQAFLRVKELLPTTASARELEGLAVDIRNRAFFSARVADAGILQTEQDLIDIILSPEGRAPGTYMDRARFREIIKDHLQSIGYTPEPGKEGTLQDLSSNDRLNLIADTNVQMAQGFGKFMQGQDTDVLDLYPCQELYRLVMPAKPENARPWYEMWDRAGGELYDGGRMIAPKDDPIWTRTIDEGGFNRFGNPYPPFDYNSGMDIRDVSRQEALELGVIEADFKAQRQTRDFNDGLQADVTAVAPSLQQALLDNLPAGFELVNGILRFIKQISANKDEAIVLNYSGQPRDSLGKWVDENGGGLSDDDNIKRGEKALERAIGQRRDVKKAMWRKEVGQIDFDWGTPGDKKLDYAGGWGLHHILEKHGARDLQSLPISIAKGKIVPHPIESARRLVQTDSYEASLVRKNSRSAWVLTGYTRRQAKP